MQTYERRYDIDWLRVIAITFLLIYHIAIVFQPWGAYIGFIQSEETSNAIWIPMAMLNVWRIPLLFFVSGMGVCFALRRRNWKELLIDRAKRILLPLLFGSFCIVPVHIYLFQLYYENEIYYSASVGHLWFLLNICIYITQIIGFAFLDQNYDYKFFDFFRKILKHPYLIYLFIIPFILEAVLINPEYFSLYVGSAHGFLLGMLAFFFGFLFIAIGNIFWISVERVKLVSLIVAFSLYIIRLVIFELQPPNYLASIESMNWIFAIFGYSYKYMNKPSKILNYFSQSVYPVYIVHMIFLFWAAYIILPLDFSLELNFLIIVTLTFLGSFVSFELLKRFNLLRPLFGITGKHVSSKKLNLVKD